LVVFVQLKIYTSKNIASLKECYRQKTMETSAKYVVGMPPCPPSVQRAKIGQLFCMKLHTKNVTVLNSAYFQCVASRADSMIMAGQLEPGREQELIDEAIAFTDMLIELVGEKM
jgi:hypothetical protein